MDFSNDTIVQNYQEEAFELFNKVSILSDDFLKMNEERGFKMKATRFLKKVLEIDPDNVDSLIFLAQIYQKQELFQESKEHYEKVLEIEPDNIEALILKGNFYRELGKYNESLKLFDKILKIDPDNNLTLGKKCFILLKLEKYSEVVTNCDKILEKDPYNPIIQKYKKLGLEQLPKTIEEKVVVNNNICRKCLNDNSKDSKFCNNCGNELVF